MNPIYLTNYLIFGAFLTLFVLEIGVALLSLLASDDYKARLVSYITPIWEVNGTFIVFYMVNFEVAYPTLLYLAGTIYIAIALLAGLIFILRNSFLAYSEYISGDTGDMYLKIYAVSTLVVAFLALSVFSSSLSGVGINLQEVSINVPLTLFNPFNILMFISVVLITAFVSTNFFNIREIKKYSAGLLLLALVIIYAILHQYVPYTLAGAFTPLMLAFFAFTVVAAVLSFTSFRFTGYVALVWFFTAVAAFGTLEYPYIFGGRVDITHYLTTPTMAYAALPITVIGGLMVLASLSYLIYLGYIKGRGTPYRPVNERKTAGDREGKSEQTEAMGN